MKKILTVIFVLCLCLTLTVSAYASDASYMQNLQSESTGALNNTVDTDETADGEVDKSADDTSLSEPKPYEILSKAYDVFISNSDKLFSLFSFICSLVLAFVYKKGLVPMLGGALKGVSGKVNEIDAATRLGIDNTKAAIDKLYGDINNLGELTKDTKDTVKNFEDTLVKIDKWSEQNEKTRLALLMQSEMLKAIFLSSSLPEYQKDEISKKSLEIEKILKDDVNDAKQG